jgi:3' terminal RNA ribose 2'-O-methyltransferase Hen1
VLLTLSTTMPDATDLGFLVHKHPDKAQSFQLAVGTAHVLWPEATTQRSTVALLLEVDPISLVRGRGGRGDSGFSLSQYVNDRPYAASSMLAVALGKVFRTAMTGRCDARPELAAAAVPLEVHVPALPSRGGRELVERLFAPLGWSVTTTPIALDEQIPAWGESPYVDLRLSGRLTVAAALTQLYVLMPVLDDSKHYWVSTEEVDKLLRAGGSWLGKHPERDLITRRYLGHSRTLVQDAVSRLAEVDDDRGEALLVDAADEPEQRATPLRQLRTAAVLAALRDEGASSVVDLGCGEGALLRELVADPAFGKVLGVDVSHRALEVAERRLRLDRMPDSQRARLQLLQSSATYRDDRLAGHDAVVLMEVIEHVDPPRLPALVRSVFAHARPTSVLVTTPNAEHNVRFPFLPAGAMRHRDHRFEWTRREFQDWAGTTAADHGYVVRHLPVGEDDPEVGPPTQLAIFRRSA